MTDANGACKRNFIAGLVSKLAPVSPNRRRALYSSDARKVPSSVSKQVWISYVPVDRLDRIMIQRSGDS